MINFSDMIVWQMMLIALFLYIWIIFEMQDSIYIPLILEFVS